MADDEDVLGAVPEVPEDLWERLLTVTFAAPPGQDDLALIPDAGEHDGDPGFDWVDADDVAPPHDEHPHGSADHGDVFEALPLDDHHDSFGPADHD